MTRFIRTAVLALALAPLARTADPPAADKAPPPGKPERAYLTLNTGGHTGAVRGVFFLDDGKKVVSVGDDRTIRFWDVATGAAEQVYHLPPLNGSLGLRFDHTLAALAPDGKRLAVSTPAPAGGASWVYLFDIPSRTLTATARRPAGGIDAFAWSPDGKTLAATVERSWVELWDVTPGFRLRATSARFRQAHYLLYAPDGGRLLMTADAAVHVLDPATGKPLPGGFTAPDNISALCWNKDGQSVTARTWGGKVWALDPAGKVVAEAKAPSPGQAIVARGTGGEVLVGRAVVDASQNKKKTQIRTRLARPGADDDEETGRTPTFAAAWSPQGVAAVATEGEVILWNAAGRGVVSQVLHRLTGRGEAISSVGWGKDGTRVAWGHHATRDRELTRAFDFGKLEPGKPDDTFTGADVKRGDLALKKVPSKGDAGYILQVFRGDTPVSHPKGGGGNPLLSYSFLGDDRVLIGGGRGATLFETATAKAVHQFTGATHVRALAPRPDAKYFAAGTQAQTVHLYRPDRKEPLLSLFAGGEDWVAWAPEGYYAASPSGERLMGWLVDNGPDTLATFHPAARFRNVFYRPDVVKETFATGSVEAALAKLGAKPAELEKVLPPQVRIVAPGARVSVTESGALTVTAEATGTADHPVKTLQLLVNGRPYQPFEGTRGVRVAAKPAAGVKRETWEVTLTPGKVTTVAVSADNGTTSAVSDAVEVTYTPKTTPKTDDTAEALHVLAIGINAYEGDLALRCAVNDANKLSDALAANGKALFPRGVFATTKTDAQANKAGILAALDELKAKVKPQDVAVVFFAGHGHPERSDRKFYLLPHGVDMDALGKTAVSEDELKDKLMALDGRVVLVLDACHSGSLKVDGLASRRGADGDLAERKYADEQVGIVVWTAAHGKDVAKEAGGHGLFTRAAIDGLFGKAKRNSRGEITLFSLQSYVLDEVQEKTGYTQRPNLYYPPAVLPYPIAKPSTKAP